MQNSSNSAVFLIALNNTFFISLACQRLDTDGGSVHSFSGAGLLSLSASMPCKYSPMLSSLVKQSGTTVSSTYLRDHWFLLELFSAVISLDDVLPQR